jgi:hypothetical protein
MTPTRLRVGLDTFSLDKIKVIEYALSLRSESRIWARDVGCAKYPRSVPKNHM